MSRDIYFYCLLPRTKRKCCYVKNVICSMNILRGNGIWGNSYRDVVGARTVWYGLELRKENRYLALERWNVDIALRRVFGCLWQGTTIRSDLREWKWIVIFIKIVYFMLIVSCKKEILHAVKHILDIDRDVFLCLGHTYYSLEIVVV